MKASYDNGNWDTGQFQYSTHSNLIGLGWWDMVGGSGSGGGNIGVTTVANTYIGDFSGDGTVELTDLNIWKADFGLTPADF